MVSAANKAKGTRFESEVADYLQMQGISAKRLPRTGVKDIGDLAFPITVPGFAKATVVVEAKNRKSMDLPTFIAEAEVEAQNYEVRYPADGVALPLVITKRRGKGVHQSYVVMPLDGLIELLRTVGAV
jgi:Holliday junction resolvase